MKKVDLIVSLKNNDKFYKNKIIGNLLNEENILFYVEEFDIKTKVKYDYLNNILKRDNNNICMEYNFEKETGFYFIKNINKKVHINLKVNEFKIIDKSIYIKYLIEEDEYIYEVKLYR